MSAGNDHDLDGPTSSEAPQGGIAFHSLRDYEFDDDWRLIHWKSSARTGTLMVRHNVVPDEPRLMVMLDTSASPYSERTFEEAVSAAASLCVAATRDGHPLEIRTTAGGVVAVDGAGDSTTAVLDWFAGVTRSDHEGLGALRRIIPPDESVAVTVITGQPGAELLAALPALRPRFSMVSLIQFAEELTESPAAPQGIVTLTVRDSDEFTASWNHLVRP